MYHKLRYSLKAFIHDSRSVGLLLLACTVISLLLCNLSAGSSYLAFWHQPIDSLEAFHLPHTPIEVINDLLMAVFFFLAGMEIKRELIKGELASLKKASLPVVGAILGVLAPAVIFLLFNRGTGFEHGWGIPTATDIAFSIGVAALLGPKVPYSLKIFLTALAIIDDLCAILIIALFYGGQIAWLWLLTAVVCMVLLQGVNKWSRGSLKHVMRISLGLLLWFATFKSGIHPTIAGILLAFMIPVDELPFYEKRVHFPVNFIIIPLFALANTCILLPENLSDVWTSTVSWGIFLGLFIGKPLGISLICFTGIKAGWFKLPEGATRLQFIGITILAGIGFTMSIFVTSLAYDTTQLQTDAKLSILVASILAMIVGYIWLNAAAAKNKRSLQR